MALGEPLPDLLRPPGVEPYPEEFMGVAVLEAEVPQEVAPEDITEGKGYLENSIAHGE